MRRARVLLLILALIAPIEAGCHKNLTFETPKAQAAMRADDIVVRVNELQAAVIQACGPDPVCQPNGIDTNTARAIVQASIDIRAVLKSTPDGWQATVKTAWAQIKPRFAGITNVAIQAAFGLVEAAIGAL